MIKLFKNYLFVYRFIAMRLMQSYVFFRNQTTFATILPQISISGGALVSARLCRLPEQEVHQPSKRWSLPQIARIYTEAACWGCSPTEYAEFTEALAEWSSHRLHRFTQKLLTSGGALVSSAPTKQTVILPQIAQIYTELLVGDVLPQISQIYTEAANFRGCTCLKCTNQARSAPTKQTVILPQIAQIYTELLVGDVLPQISQNSQNFLLNGSPTDFTDLHRSC